MDATLDDMSDVLQRVQQTQFVDRPAAERMLVSLVRELFGLDIARVELRPREVSLNSFNGLLTLGDGTQLFFKSHTESDTVIAEYYNAAILAEAGYPVLQPVLSSTEVGRQFLIYDVVEEPSVFDVAWEIERGKARLLPGLSDAQRVADCQLWSIYHETLNWQSAENAARSPVHQLFSHRLVGGRLDLFLGKTRLITLPGVDFSLADVRSAKWVINGQRYEDTLDDLVVAATDLLRPDQSGPSVIGHGDAHNANMFHRSQDAGLLYFDPAFAGRHDPLLDLTKPLFHNVFAMWMYFPKIVAAEMPIKFFYQKGRFELEYDYQLHQVRRMFLRSKIDRVVIPLLRELNDRGWLPTTWREYLKAALFCCPLLTVNLSDANRFPPEISLLGLANAVEMGSDSSGARSLIDQILDEAEEALSGPVQLTPSPRSRRINRG